ncbi:MAG: RnfH family protein [Pseudoxanthomonas suwonensis]|nr:RnfH family protein [Pseudoxanthomonas suwonensis]
MTSLIHVEVVQAWPRRQQSWSLALAPASAAADALIACGLDPASVAGLAVFGDRVTASHVLRDGDRLEVLRPLLVDPKQARRLRAEAAREAKR